MTSDARQKNVPNTPVPEICILDPDGDMVRHLHATGCAQPVALWSPKTSACSQYPDETLRDPCAYQPPNSEFCFLG